jgi:hypothetical protein
MITKKETKGLVIAGALVVASCVMYRRLNASERRRFKKSMKVNTGLFLVNLAPYVIGILRSPKQVDEVAGPTPYSTVEL